MVIAHCPALSPVSLCSPTLLNGLRSVNAVAASSAASKSSANSISSPENLEVLPNSWNRWVRPSAKDLIMQSKYNATRTTSSIHSAHEADRLMLYLLCLNCKKVSRLGGWEDFLRRLEAENVRSLVDMKLVSWYGVDVMARIDSLWQ